MPTKIRTNGLSATSKVVVLLREWKLGKTFTALDVEKGSGVDRAHVSSALTWFRDRGYIEFDGKEGPYYRYRLVASLKEYPLRKAPAPTTRNRQSGFKVKRMDTRGARWHFIQVSNEFERVRKRMNMLEAKLNELRKHIGLEDE